MRKPNDVALNVVSARLKVGHFDKIVRVNGDEKEIVFEVDLPKGEQSIQTWFTTQQKEQNAAYYTYIESAKSR